MLPTNVGLGMGWLGQYMYILPTERLVVVTLGETWGESLQCDGDKANGYDDAWSATQVWRAFRNATAAKGGDAASMEDLLEVEKFQRQHMAAAMRHSQDEAAAAVPVQPAMESDAIDRGGRGGSCQCSCPPGRGFGYCFEMPEGTPPNDAGCNIVDTTAPLLCPDVGVPKQCHDPPIPEDVDCSAVGDHMHGDVGDALVWGGSLNCSVTSRCNDGHGDARFSSMTCGCKAWRIGRHGCAWCATSLAAHRVRHIFRCI